MKALFEWLTSVQTILLIYAFVLGWMLRSRYKGILNFLQEHWIPIFCVGFFIILPFSCLGLFFVNLYVWQIDLLTYLLLGIWAVPSIIWVWFMRTGNKEKPQ